MKHSLALCFAGFALTATVSAAETVTAVADPALPLTQSLGKQVSIRLSDAIVKDRFAQADFDGVLVSGLPEGRICFSGREQGIDPDDPRLKDLARADDNDVCVPRDAVAFRHAAQTAPGAPPSPFYATDLTACQWVWTAGRDVGLWTEDCTFSTGRWQVSYDAANDWFALAVDGEDPMPVLRSFAGGPQALLPELKAKGLVLDDKDGGFQQISEPLAPRGWTAWEVAPVGQRKTAFDALPKDEVPDPPCGDLGMVVDSIGFFMVKDDEPGRTLHIDLGQDGTMIDPSSITFVK
jgi:hypothetical protein